MTQWYYPHKLSASALAAIASKHAVDSVMREAEAKYVIGSKSGRVDREVPHG